jgi:hypothetical protein
MTLQVYHPCKGYLPRSLTVVLNRFKKIS